jgi:hypothetical protein
MILSFCLNELNLIYFEIRDSLFNTSLRYILIKFSFFKIIRIKKYRLIKKKKVFILLSKKILHVWVKMKTTQKEIKNTHELTNFFEFHKMIL